MKVLCAVLLWTTILHLSIATNWNTQDYDFVWTEITNTDALNKTVTTRGYTQAAGINNTLYVFGGEGNDPNVLTYGDLEVYNAKFNSWTNITDSNSIKPLDRASHASTFIPDRNSFVVFCGWSQNGSNMYLTLLNDTWEYFLANGTWKELQVANGSETIPAQTSSTIVYDSNRKVLIACGGTETFESNKTWEYSFETKKWHLVTNATGFPPREDHAAVYMPYDKSVYVFGGAGTMREWNFVALNDLLRYNTTTTEWTTVNVSGGPPALFGHVMSLWDEETFILHGGCHNMTVTPTYAPYCDVFGTKTYLFNARLQKWTVISSNSTRRYYHMGGVVRNSPEDNPSFIFFGGLSMKATLDPKDGTTWKLEVRAIDDKEAQTTWLVLFPVVGGVLFVIAIATVFVVLRQNMLRTGVWVFS